jgi:uncharacterized lipoprotein YmbA
MVRLTNENSVQISETDRSSAPFDEMVRNILSQDLAALLPKGRLILPQAPAPAGTGTNVVMIAQFGPDASGSIRLNGSWALLQSSSGRPVLERNFQFDVGPAPDANVTTAGMSQTLSRPANAIASDVSKAGI